MVSLCGGPMLAASVWKYVSENDGDVYRIQVNNVDNRTRPIVESSLPDWETSGEGWNNDGQILFFIKKFSDQEDMERWAKKFKQFSLKILDRDGKSKREIKVKNPIILKQTQRICSKCKGTGHNSATCRNFHRKQATAQDIVPTVAIEEKGTRTCSKCNMRGHNARTCKYK